MVRMGEIAVSRTRGDELVALGLGSCVGVALVDRRSGAAGLAHVVLPASGGSREDENALKFADRAVPALVDRVVAAGGRRGRLEAVLVGGASMFAGSALEVGARNEVAVREQLAALDIPVVADATGGSRGRTVRVQAGATAVRVREAGGTEEQLMGVAA